MKSVTDKHQADKNLDDNVSEGGPRFLGVVKWFAPEKCFGFIERPPEEDGSKPADIFVHFRGIRGSGWRNLKENQVVDFEIVQGNKGPQAQDVNVVAEAHEEHELRPASALVTNEPVLEEAA